MAAATALAAIIGFARASAQQASADVPQRERKVLMELYVATNGERWTNSDGWGSTRPVCYWYGVTCDFVDADGNAPSVVGLNLSYNNLVGAFPTIITALSRLQRLDVSGNRLTGSVPESLLERWDDHTFEFDGGGNSLANFVIRASLEYSAATLCGQHDDLRYRLEVDDISGWAVFQSIRCADERSRRTYCLVREGRSEPLGRFSRSLKAVGFINFQPKYDYSGNTFRTHGPYITTTAIWGDQSQVSVETYDRQGPRDVWAAQQLFLGLLSDIYWEKESRKPRCDFQK